MVVVVVPLLPTTPGTEIVRDAHPPGREPRRETSADHNAGDVAIVAFFAVLFGEIFRHARQE